MTRNALRWTLPAALALAGVLSSCEFSGPGTAAVSGGSSGSGAGRSAAERASIAGVEPVEPDDLLAAPPKIHPVADQSPDWNFGAAAADANKMVIFQRSPGRTRTGSGASVAEAVVRYGTVESSGGQNSYIPTGGYVVAGTGEAAQWIRQHLPKGTVVRLEGDTLKAVPGFEAWESRFKEYLAAIERRLAKVRADNKADARQMLLAESHLRAARADWAFAQGELAKSLRVRSLAEAPPEEIELAKRQDKEAFRLLGQAFARAELAGSVAVASPAREARAAWRRVEASSPEELRADIAEVARAGFNILIIEALYDGETIYPTSRELIFQAPRFRGWDPMAVAVEASRKHGLTLYAAVNALKLGLPSQSPIARKEPGWLELSRSGQAESPREAGAVFLSPANMDARNWVLGNIRELSYQYGVAGVLVSSLRYPSSAGLDDEFGYNASARQAFLNERGADPAGLSPASNPELWQAWREARSANVGAMAQAIREELRRAKPELKLGFVVYPSLQTENLGQDWTAWVGAGLADWGLLMNGVSFAGDGPEGSARLLSQAKSSVPADFPLLAGVVDPDRSTVLGLSDALEAVRASGMAGPAVVEFGQLSSRARQSLRLGAFRQQAAVPEGVAGR